MTSFRSLKGNCSICNGARRDCRSNTTKGLIHCRHNDIGTISGFRFVGQDALGFNMWAVDDGRSRDDADWEELRRQRAVERERRHWEESAHFAQLLSVDERDRNIRKIHAQLGLSTRHRQNLRDRGLTPAQIDAGKYFSIAPWCEVQGINPRLAGVDLDGRKLLIGQSGFACPVWDVQGRIIGWQTRFDDDSDGGKYKWATSRSSKRPNGGTAHLQNGELPISCCRPLNGVKLASIGLAEGFLKPYITAQRRGQVAIGAAGGNFAGSPIQLKADLEVLAEELNTKILDLYPDAGAIVNKAVMGHYQRTIQLVSGWGYTVRVAWWGQLTKEQPDIDELLDDLDLRYLTWEEFLELSQREIRLSALKATQAKLNSLTYPALAVNQRYLDIQFPLEGIQFVKSPMGTGKTEAIKRLTEDCQSKGTKLLLLGNRNGLLFQTSQRTGISHLHDLQVVGEPALTASFIGSSSTIAMCIDSIWRIRPQDLQKATVVIDEAESVIEHLLAGNTCSERRAELCIKLGEIVRIVCSTGGRIVLMDAGLTDVSIDYIKPLAPPNTPITGIVNSYKPDTAWNVEFSNGTTDGVKQFTRDDSAILDLILKCLEGGGIPVICTDSQEGAKALDMQLTKAGFSGGLRVDGETSEQDPLVKLFLNDPNQYIRDIRPKWLIYTPTAESGLSIDEPYFTVMFALFRGVVATKTQMQMLGRVRYPIPRYVFSVAHGFKDLDCSNQLPDEIEIRLLQYHTSNNLVIGLADYLSTSDDPTDLDRLIALQQMFDQKTNSWNNSHLKTWAKLKARANYSLANLRTELRAALIAAGHQVKDVFNLRNLETKDEFKGLRDEIKFEKAAAIANEKDIPIGHAREILQSEGATLTERFQAHKAILADAVPGVPLTPEFVLKAKIENRGEWLKQIRMDWMLRHPEVQAKLDRNAWAKHLSLPLVMPQDIRAYSQKLKVLTELGLLELLLRDKVFSADSPEVIKLMRLAKSKSMATKLQNALGVTVTSKTDSISFLRRIFKRVGAFLYCMERTRTPDGKQKRFYKIKEDYWTQADRLAVLEAMDRKYAPLMNSMCQSSVPVAETYTTQTIDPCQHSTIGVYINSECWHTQKTISSAAENNQEQTANSSSPTVLAAPIRSVIPVQLSWGVGLVMPGTIVECLGRAGRWTIKYCTGVVAKICDRYGQEEIVNCQNLRLAGVAA